MQKGTVVNVIMMDANFIDQIETLAIEKAKQLFNCTYANVQPLSVAQTN